MEPEENRATESKEKEWADAAHPSSPSDDRDKEQLLRQYKEAKRRKDNLSENEETKTDH